MFGMIGKFTTVPGKRDEVMSLISGASASMPGNLVYLIAADAQDPDVIWISESWESEESHANSLQIHEVREAITAAMPMISGVETVAKTVPLQ